MRHWPAPLGLPRYGFAIQAACELGDFLWQTEVEFARRREGTFQCRSVADHRIRVKVCGNFKAVPAYDLGGIAAQGIESAKKVKCIISKEMTREQIAEAQKLSCEWLAAVS